MRTVTIRCYAELNELIDRNQRGSDFHVPLKQQRSVKDLIESTGIPHTEVDLVLIDGVSVDFSRMLTGGERISLFPRFHRLPLGTTTRVRIEPEPDDRFLLDVHLGKLTTMLRMLGIDAAAHPEAGDTFLAETASREHRTLLTRDRGLLMRQIVRSGYLVRSLVPEEQLLEVIRRFELKDRLRPFTRCMACNGHLDSVEKAAVIHRLPNRVRTSHDAFWRCRSCDKVYWRGTHYEKMVAWIERLRTKA